LLHHFDRLWSISAGCARSCSVLINLCQLFPFFHFFPFFLLFSSFFFFFFFSFIFFISPDHKSLSFLPSVLPSYGSHFPFHLFPFQPPLKHCYHQTQKILRRGDLQCPCSRFCCFPQDLFLFKVCFSFCSFSIFFFFFFFESLILIIQQKKPTSVSSSSLSGGGLWAESEEIQDLFPRLRESPRTHLPDRILRLQWKRKKIVTMIGLRNWIENAPIEKPAQMGKPL